MPDLHRKEEATDTKNPTNTTPVLKIDLGNISPTNSINAELKVNEIPKIKIDSDWMSLPCQVFL